MGGGAPMGGGDPWQGGAPGWDKPPLERSDAAALAAVQDISAQASTGGTCLVPDRSLLCFKSWGCRLVPSSGGRRGAPVELVACA